MPKVPDGFGITLNVLQANYHKTLEKKEELRQRDVKFLEKHVFERFLKLHLQSFRLHATINCITF